MFLSRAYVKRFYITEIFILVLSCDACLDFIDTLVYINAYLFAG